MRIAISSQWDDDFLLECKKYGVSEIYGSLRQDPIGNIRPAVCLPDASLEQAKEHIKKVHELGMEFNYIVNTPCLGNIEFSKDGRDKIMEYLQTIHDLGADIITIAIPYLIEVVKKEFPDMRVKVSEVADVGTAQRAKFFSDMGIDLITVELTATRNFKVLESIRKVIRPEVILEVIVNAACINQCPYHNYHNNMIGHTTQIDHFLHGYYMDLCMMKCIPKKLQNPEEIIKAPWIRPEDVKYYEEIGVDSIKISNRVGPSTIGHNCLEAYTKRSCKNMAELLTPLSLEIEEPKSSKLEGFTEEEWAQMVKVWGIKSPAVTIDNEKLDGFIDHFRKNNCYSQCGAGCNYCKEIAKKAVSIDGTKEEVDAYVDLIHQLAAPITSMSRPSKEKEGCEGTGMWSAKNKEFFDKLMESTPDMFRDVAKKQITMLAETKAKEEKRATVEIEDIVKALLEGTPKVFQGDMIKGLEESGIDVSKYLSE